MSVVARDVRGCVIFDNGMLQCWGGFNFDGQLGIGSTQQAETPTWVLRLRDVKKLALGDDVTCAIVGSGALYCWGENQFLKNDARKGLLEPTQVPGITRAIDVSIGWSHTCAVDAAGDVYCWGQNSYGQLGLGAREINKDAKEPTRVPGISDVVGVASGREDTYAWTRSGDLYRWGTAGEPIRAWAAPEPRKVIGVSNVTRVWVEGQDVCALMAGGAVRCFIPEGLDALAAGKQLDLGPQMLALVQAIARKKHQNLVIKNLVVPDAHEMKDVVDVLVFNHDSSALTSNGEVFSWGSADSGTVGRPERTKGLWPPTKIAGLSDITQIAGGFMHRCGLKKDGTVHCFGGRAPGRPKGAANKPREVGQEVRGLPKITQIASGDHCTFALAEDHTVWAFGDSWVNACGAKETDTVTFDVPRPIELDKSPPP